MIHDLLILVPFFHLMAMSTYLVLTAAQASKYQTSGRFSAINSHKRYTKSHQSNPRKPTEASALKSSERLSRLSAPEFSEP